jgi:membrane-bound lytic murein transglycosylase D
MIEPTFTPTVRVRAETESGPYDHIFQKSFFIGRVDETDVCIKNEFVSRRHAEVTLMNRQWSVTDLGSSNGIFVNGQRVQKAVIEGELTIRLGIEGPKVHFAVEKPPPPPAPPKPVLPEPMSEKNIERYFQNPSTGGPAGEHTILVRHAFAQVQKKQKRKYGGVMAVLGLCLVGAGGYAWFLQQQVSKQKALAVDLFYTMKAQDLVIAGLEGIVRATNSQQGAAELSKSRDLRKQMEKKYDKFLDGLHVYDAKLTQEQRLVLRIARIFGECELEMPPEFMTEINNYIAKWKGSNRLATAVKRAQENGYIPTIVKELEARDLPPQFIYLALQESNFDAYATGPPTRSGIAKGMWQFIPQTALDYGLKLGPLTDLPRRDVADDRHHWDRATKAAASYLKFLYSTDAKASGFLVMSCYNWGEGSVLPLVRKMPINPRERNFWHLLAMGKEKIPEETYNYVFYIASAAVIGENPRLFGFDFDNPLGYLDSKQPLQ